MRFMRRGKWETGRCVSSVPCGFLRRAVRQGPAPARARGIPKNAQIYCDAYCTHGAILLFAPYQMQQPWDIASASALYNIERWGSGYFGINDKGHVQVFPTQDEKTPIDLF